MKKTNFWYFNFLCTFNTFYCVELNSEQLCQSYLGDQTLNKKVILKKPKKNEKIIYYCAPNRNLIYRPYWRHTIMRARQRCGQGAVRCNVGAVIPQYTNLQKSSDQKREGRNYNASKTYSIYFKYSGSFVLTSLS